MDGVLRYLVLFLTDIVRFLAKITLAFATGTLLLHVADGRLEQIQISVIAQQSLIVRSATGHPLSLGQGIVVRPAGFVAPTEEPGDLLRKVAEKLRKERERVRSLARQKLLQQGQEASVREGVPVREAPVVDLPPTKATAPAASKRESLRRGRPFESGIASFYGKRWNGRKTANGEIFDSEKYTAAHKTLPFGTFVRVVRKDNGRSVVVRINDRGPFKPGRIIDLSTAGARRLGMLEEGLTEVELYPATLVDFLKQFER